MGMTAVDVELAVAKHFNLRTNVIVPNVSWGIGLPYEADLVVLRPSGYSIEVEIKVLASDIKDDLKKRHKHDSHLFKELWFAVPEDLECNRHIPDRAGVLSVRKVYSKELDCGDYRPGRYVWVTDGKPIVFATPAPFQGKQGLYNVPFAVVADIECVSRNALRKEQ